MPKYKTIIFVHGCFWHKHKDCKYAHIPKSNTKFWIDKITSNVERDKINAEKLSISGWNVLTVWECEIRHKYKQDITPLIDKKNNSMKENQFCKFSVKLFEEQESKISIVVEEVVEFPKDSIQ